MTAAEWEPGVPIFRQSENGGSGHRLHIFNFRDDSESDTCHCADAASWPNPAHRPLGEGDELGDFIADWHQWRAIEESA